MENFQLEDNNCYATVTSMDHERSKMTKIITQEKEGNKNVIKYILLLLFTIVIVLLVHA